MNEKIILLDELGQEQEFVILATFGLDDEDYAALMPSNDIDGPTYILRMDRDDMGELLLVGIDDDEELQEAIDAYEEMQKENLQ
ncbi:DUF1292 domain-containing protein [Tissierella praeacuta]|uniref:DUF1292 domain-containing protein n=1 Tax=Tissierella praeacuta TaxID=43131 RepID=UPI001C1161AF|nr:DUF1292 domain-containing protein [Tissierella praeacuta]MBU5254924.1 DUF1292 domain-containing protein [Tissierella praeacuta]